MNKRTISFDEWVEEVAAGVLLRKAGGSFKSRAALEADYSCGRDSHDVAEEIAGGDYSSIDDQLKAVLLAIRERYGVALESISVQWADLLERPAVAVTSIEVKGRIVS